jgi:hypothetical protein
MPQRTLPAAALAIVTGLACAHPRAPAAPAAEILWPEPPGAPRARLARVFPDAARPKAKQGWWRRAFGALVGLDAADADAELPLVRPFGVASRAAGELLVADPDAPSVSRVTAAGGIDALSCRGEPWVAPMALAVAEDGALWVADAGAGEVVRRAADGSCSRLGRGVLERPTGVAVAAERVFVADPPRHEVVVFATRTGAVSRIGGRGEADGELSFPSALALDRDGNLLVVDALNFRIARFSPDGRWLGSFGAPGTDGSGFARPKAVAAASDGRIFVTDAQRDLVLVFLPDGSFDYAIGASGSAAGRFTHPAGISVRDGRVSVADSHNHRVQVFELLGDRS